MLPKVFADTGEEWSHLFNELFVPCDEIIERIYATGLGEKSYVAVHFRFVNALENFEKYYDNALSTQEEKDNLIKRCKDGLGGEKRKSRSGCSCVFRQQSISGFHSRLAS